MQNEVFVRSISGIILGIFVLTLTWFGGLGFLLLTILLMALVFFEWFRIVQTRSLSRAVWLIGVCSIAAIAVALFAGSAWAAFSLAVAGALLVAVKRRLEGRDLWPSLGIIYAGFFAIAFLELRGSGDQGFALMVFLFAIIWSTDVFAFFGGRAIGGPKLAPAISPKKTWSGFLCGLGGGLIAGLIAASAIGDPHYLWIAVLAILLSVSGQAGDLFESALKRRFAVKDSGMLIPGHGGVMDRIDSMIFAAFTAYIVGVAVSGDGLIENGGNGLAARLLGI